MQNTLSLQKSRVATPVGELWIVTDSAGDIRACEWHDYEARLLKLLARHCPNGFELHEQAQPTPVSRAFEAYFAGQTRALESLAVASIGSSFQREVWRALRTIPLGCTWSYSELAEHLGRPRAVRAVGLANGANPISVVVPCHRVIGASGALTGYAGGLARKRWLLEHEGVNLTERTTARSRSAA